MNFGLPGLHHLPADRQRPQVPSGIHRPRSLSVFTACADGEPSQDFRLLDINTDTLG